MKSKKETLKQTWAETSTKNGYLSRGRVKEEVAGPYFFTKKGTWLSSVHGFAKNEKATLTHNELKAFKEFCNLIFSYDDHEINKAIEKGVFIEVTV
jgi:hypothetical protein